MKTYWVSYTHSVRRVSDSDLLITSDTIVKMDDYITSAHCIDKLRTLVSAEVQSSSITLLNWKLLK